MAYLQTVGLEAPVGHVVCGRKYGSGTTERSGIKVALWVALA